MGSVHKLKSPKVFEDDVKIEQGEYKATFVRADTYPYLGGCKLRVLCRICEGRHEGIILGRHYNVKKHRKGWSVGKRSDFTREFQQVTQSKIEQFDNVPIEELHQHVLLIRVRTVGKSSKGDELAPINRYSVIGELIRSAT